MIMLIFLYTKEFPREYKYTLGQDIHPVKSNIVGAEQFNRVKRDSIKLVRSIYRANRNTDKRQYLEEFLDNFEILKLEIRLCADGATLAIGYLYNNDNGSNAGQVRVYENQGGTWVKIGNNIDGEQSRAQFGGSVSLSADGLSVAGGARYYNNDAGQTVIFEYGLADPNVYGYPASNITANQALSGGQAVLTNSVVTDKGVCWSTNPGPTTADNHTSDGAGLGVYSSTITGLSPSTTYYVRAYATNSTTTEYSLEYSFTSLPPPSVWNGPLITFTKADNADWTQEQNQDRFSDNVWITRKNNQGIFNIKTSTGWNEDCEYEPFDTEWALEQQPI